MHLRWFTSGLTARLNGFQENRLKLGCKVAKRKLEMGGFSEASSLFLSCGSNDLLKQFINNLSEMIRDSDRVKKGGLSTEVDKLIQDYELKITTDELMHV